MNVYQAKTAKLETCREVVREVAGLLQYERRLLDMLKTGGASSEKRMYKFAKKRVCIPIFMPPKTIFVLELQTGINPV